MNAPTLFGLCAAALVGLGLYGVIIHPQPLRKILAFNLIGNGVFLLFGAIARRGAAAGLGGDPVPQGLLITGIVVAFSATALAIALLVRLFQASGSATLRDTCTGAWVVGPAAAVGDGVTGSAARLRFGKSSAEANASPKTNVMATRAPNFIQSRMRTDIGCLASR